MLKNTTTSYGSMSKGLHWIMAVLIIGLLIVGIVMNRMDPSPDKWELYGLHKAFGVIAFTLILIRIAWKSVNPDPELPLTTPKWQQYASKINILSLYALMVLMPFSGMGMSLLGGHPINFFGLFTIEALSEKNPIGGIAHEAHWILGYIMIGLLILHVAAALQHHFIHKDNVLRRMLPW
jgi:cytochrome b561